MTDKYMIELDSITTLKDTDLFLTTRDPAGTPLSKKLAASVLATGWIEVTNTWTYASSSTVTVPSDATLKYQKGDKVRFKQGGGYKYFVVTNVASTVLTLFGGSDYSVANSAITDIAFSRRENPFGFPELFNWTPSLTNISGYTVAKIKVTKDIVSIILVADYKNVTSSGIVTFSLPIPVAQVVNFPIAVHNGTAWDVALCQIYSSQVDVRKTIAAGTWAGTETNVRISLQASYIF